MKSIQDAKLALLIKNDTFLCVSDHQTLMRKTDLKKTYSIKWVNEFNYD